MKRNYEIVCASAAGLRGEREERASGLVDILWDALAPTGVSWVGFYHGDPGGQELTLGARRDKPACSPIGLHGACGRVFLSGEPLVVRDVAELGENYVACDPRDKSEVVVPCFDERGVCWGVLDLDSFDAGSFSDEDARGLRDALLAAGLTTK